MFFNEVKIRDLNFSNFPSGENYYSKGQKLFFKKPAPSKSKITVGFSAYPFGYEEFIFKKMGAFDELIRKTNFKNNFNIYYEKHEYIRTLNLIFPDVKKLCSIMNFYFESLLYYKVIYATRKMKKFETQDDIMKYCNTINYRSYRDEKI